MTGLLLVVLSASVCPAERQPGWASADGAGKRALFRACAEERKGRGETLPEVRGVSDTKPPPPPPPPPFFHDPPATMLQTATLGLSSDFSSSIPQLEVRAATLFPVAPAVWIGPSLSVRKSTALRCVGTRCDLPASAWTFAFSAWGRRHFDALEFAAGASAGVAFTVQPESGVRMVAGPEGTMTLRLGFHPVVLEVSETVTVRTVLLAVGDKSVAHLRHGISVGLVLEQVPGHFTPGLSLGTGAWAHPGNGRPALTLVAEVSASLPAEEVELRPFLRGQAVALADRGQGPGVAWFSYGTAAFAFGGGVSGTLWRGGYGFGGAAAVLMYWWNTEAFTPAPTALDGRFGVLGVELTAVPARWRFAKNTQDVSLEVGVSIAQRSPSPWWTPTARVLWSLHP